jgi:uncharacterized protein YukJ
MIPLPADSGGPDNDLNEKISFYIQKAMNEKGIIYAFGAKWGRRIINRTSTLNFHLEMESMIYT